MHKLTSANFMQSATARYTVHIAGHADGSVIFFKMAAASREFFKVRLQFQTTLT